MIGIYLSGTGNTKHCMEKLVKGLDANASVIPIESKLAVSAIRENRDVILGYPTQYSNAPLMVRDFIKEHADLWKGKNVFCVATMGLFSGDGAGCTARLLKKYGANILGGLHLHMPDSVCDSKALKKSKDENLKIIELTDLKIDNTILQIKAGTYPKEGLGPLYHLAGLFGQRLWFYSKSTHYARNLKISDACIGCGLCERLCPMHNIYMKDNKPHTKGQCTRCYRCISSCPKQAITLLGNKVVEQCQYKNYVTNKEKSSEKSN